MSSSNTSPSSSPLSQKRKRDSSDDASNTNSDEGYVSIKRPRKPSTLPQIIFHPASPTDRDRPTHTVPGLPIPNSRRKFTIWGAMCSHSALFIYFTTQFLTPEQALTLYSIDKYFHYMVNSFLPQIIYGLARRWARMTPAVMIERYRELDSNGPFQEPDICRIFPWRCYRWECIHDPAWRSRSDVPPSEPEKRSYDMTRSIHVPTFRYLRMILFRANTTRSILETLLYDHQFWLPPEIGETLGKLWFMMDIPVTGSRILLVKNRRYFTDQNLELAQLFFAKLDMALNHPGLGSEGKLHMRKMLLAQKSLSVMDRVLKRQACRNHLEALQMYVRWRYDRGKDGHLGWNVLGVSSDLLGGLEKEGWGDHLKGRPKFPGPEGVRREGPHPPHRRRLFRPDELISRESIRRGFRQNTKAFMHRLLSGYHNPNTLERWRPARVPDNWPRKWWMLQNREEEETTLMLQQQEEEAAEAAREFQSNNANNRQV